MWSSGTYTCALFNGMLMSGDLAMPHFNGLILGSLDIPVMPLMFLCNCRSKTVPSPPTHTHARTHTHTHTHTHTRTHTHNMLIVMVPYCVSNGTFVVQYWERL